jgi:hypothetical protein
MRSGRTVVCLGLLLLLADAVSARGQSASHRGFVEGSTIYFPQQAPNDSTRGVADLLIREEVFLAPTVWLRLAAGLDLRANSHDQIDDRWHLDFSDRGNRRPRLAVRRLTATVLRGPVTIDVGKQFVRWGKTDFVNPTDRFAPRDFLNVVDSEFLAVAAARGSVQLGNHTIEAVWAPRFTPSRVPLLGQRWAVLPPEAKGASIVEAPTLLPAGSQSGVRWGHIADWLEYSLSFYDGFNHLPDIAIDIRGGAPGFAQIEIGRSFPPNRTFGLDCAVPVRWFTLKGEAAYVTSSSPSTDEYVLYVVQVERQRGEWVFVGGYVGEAMTRPGEGLTFAPDRGMSHAAVGRTSVNIDANRSLAFEGAVRVNGDGGSVKAKYSQARGQHWRTTVDGVGIMGKSGDFFGQYHRNSHVRVTARYSF